MSWSARTLANSRRLFRSFSAALCLWVGLDSDGDWCGRMISALAPPVGDTANDGSSAGQSSYTKQRRFGLGSIILLIPFPFSFAPLSTLDRCLNHKTYVSPESRVALRGENDTGSMRLFVKADDIFCQKKKGDDIYWSSIWALLSYITIVMLQKKKKERPDCCWSSILTWNGGSNVRVARKKHHSFSSRKHEPDKNREH